MIEPTTLPSKKFQTRENSPYPMIKWVAADAVLVELGNRIDPQVQRRVSHLDQTINETEMVGLIETVPAYASLLLRFDPERVTYDEVESDIVHFLDTPLDEIIPARLWRIPVCFGGEFGPDMAFVAEQTGMCSDEIIHRYTATRYSVAMFGFLPGFAYLAGLLPELALPRRKTPRAKVPSGGIAIGGPQTALGSIAGPCGWHIIGRTPVQSFMPERNPATFLRIGDEIEFSAMPDQQFDDLLNAAEAGEIIAEQVA